MAQEKLLFESKGFVIAKVTYPKDNHEEIFTSDYFEFLMPVENEGELCIYDNKDSRIHKSLKIGTMHQLTVNKQFSFKCDGPLTIIHIRYFDKYIDHKN